MSSTRHLLLLAGIVLALLSAFVAAAILPWLVGGCGLAAGVLSTGPKLSRATFFGALGLVVALSAIYLQPFNPTWLGSIVFFVRVFFAHVLLAVALLRFLKVADD